MSSGTGLTATDNGDGTLSMQKLIRSSKLMLVLKHISIEGYDLAQQAPKHYIEVLDSSNEVL